MSKIDGRNARLEDIRNQRFGMLVVKDLVYNEEQRRRYALVVCDCGNEKMVAPSSLRNGKARSCGCNWSNAVSKANSTHGLSQTRLHKTWRGIKLRCLTPTNHRYEYYGGKGVTICDEWKDDFMAFYNWAMSNGYKDDLSIDRIDPYGNYEPSNCRWADSKIQARNQRIRVNNETGVTGVYYRKEQDRYRVTISDNNGNRINVGQYESLEEAKEERRKAELKYWGFTTIEN